jgi:hypothetical protein
MRRFRYLVLCLLLVLPLGVACRSAQPTPGADESPLTAADSTSQTSPLSSPLIGSVGTPPTPSSKQAGTVVGVLAQGTPPQPAQGAIVCLGEVILSPEGTPLMGGLDRASAPCARTAEDGAFLLTDVPEGRYALFLDLITNAVMLREPSQGEDFLIDVQGGSITDLGTLVYDTLPTLP